MTGPSGRHVTIGTCATVGNFGPGFDVLSLAIADRGDRITLAAADADRIDITGPGAHDIPAAWDRNVAGRAIDHLRDRTGIDTRFHVRIEKAFPGGSGLGSSASSAAGACLAYHALHPELDLSARDLVHAAMAGEAVAGGGHPDDVSAVILGGLAIVRPTDGLPDVRRVDPPEGLVLAVARPDMACPTASMRAVLPRDVAWKDATWNLGRVAGLVAAFASGDLAAVGANLDDRIALPARRALLPQFDATTAAARDAGAFGACLSGSGPSVLAVCDADTAPGVAAAMQKAVEAGGTACDSFTAEPERRIPHEAVLR